MAVGGGNVTSPSLENPLLNIAISMVIGAGFGYVSEKFAGVPVKKKTTKTQSA